MSDERPALEVKGLTKSYGRLRAVDGLDLRVEAGEWVGLIGPNGAGKSTTVQVITGQLIADAGQITVAGHEIATDALAARRHTGYVPQRLELYPFLTGREVLEFVATARGIELEIAQPRVQDLLLRFGLGAHQDRLTREYSGGMARKLAVATALIGDPALLVLDEVLTGLDPRAAAEVKEALRERVSAGGSVLMVTHALDTLERLADRVLLLDKGKIHSSVDRDTMDTWSRTGESLEAYFLAHTSA
jgi:ABC-2 type transport system ATP-binding protein